MLEVREVLEFGGVKTAVIKLEIPREKIREVMGPGIEELMGVLGEQGVKPAGAWLTHHFRMDSSVFDFEIGVPVEGEVRPQGRVEPGELPACKVARAVYVGPYEGLPDAWGEFGDWIEAQGLDASTDIWEQYEVGPESGPDESSYRTIMNVPLRG